MCGIAGVYALTERPPDPAWGKLLGDCLAHRGPDGDGVFADGRVVLAHRRLAIIDVSEAGRQPMHSADGRHVVVLNGEIYNFAEPRGRLEAQGVRFRSRSDTEVLLEALARDGPAAIAAMRGMFAFALYDRDTGDLTLARDRIGKKPLFWLRTPEFLAFASEAQALLRLPFVRPRLERGAVRDYVRFLYVPSPRTLVAGLRKLEPASILRVDGRDRAAPPEVRRYWRVPEADPARRPDRDWFRTLDERLLEATRLRTVSDVPIGLFLSGGVDSNAVLAELRRAGHSPIRAFTVGFRGLADERPLAREGARRYADQHVELVLDPDLAHEIPAILSHFGEPIGDSGIVTAALIAREAARHVKVILNGDGGDELFGGYSRYPFAARADLAGRWPGGRALFEAYYGRRPAMHPILAAWRAGDVGEAARALGSVVTPTRAHALLAADLPESPTTRPEVPGFADRGLASALFAWDTGSYLPDDLMVKADTAAMAFGLENRAPLLDHRLLEHVASLPASRRVHPLATKPLLKRAVRDRVPPGVLAAPKQGFPLPLAEWLHGPLGRWMDGLLLDPQATAPLWRDGALAREVEAFHARRHDEHAALRLWSLAVLESWARTFSIEVPRS
jgi:asparagine synthase (glutamine-hydrolysing)